MRLMYYLCLKWFTLLKSLYHRALNWNLGVNKPLFWYDFSRVVAFSFLFPLVFLVLLVYSAGSSDFFPPLYAMDNCPSSSPEASRVVSSPPGTPVAERTPVSSQTDPAEDSSLSKEEKEAVESLLPSNQFKPIPSSTWVPPADSALPRRFTYFWEDSLDIYRPFDYDESGNPRGYEAERDSLSGTFDTVSGDDFIQVEAELQARVLNPPK